MQTRFLTVLTFLFSSTLFAHANDSIITLLLKRIYEQQTGLDPYFKTGMVPCYREYALNKHRFRKDETIYFPGLIGLSLRRLKPYLNEKDQQVCDSIFANIAKIAPAYKNQKGRNTYNFWPTDTIKFFPNSGWLNNKFGKSLALADDLDDTSILLLALGASDSEVAPIHTFMREFVNRPENKARNSLKPYYKYPAYSCWFGKNMMVEYDVCVMANILYLSQVHHLPYTGADSATLNLLCSMIAHKDYMHYPKIISVYFKKPSIILYHISRLMSIIPIPALEQYKPQLIEDAKYCLKHAHSLIEKTILRTSLLRWGVEMGDYDVLQTKDIVHTIETDPMPYFIANLALTAPKAICFSFAYVGVSRFHFFCPAYYDLLMLEYLVLNKISRAKKA